MKPPLQWPTQRHDAHASFTFTAGIMLCGKIREYLESRRFEGVDFEWREGRGWIEREWIIRGAPAAVQLIQGDMKAWVKDNNLRAPN